MGTEKHFEANGPWKAKLGNQARQNNLLKYGLQKDFNVRCNGENSKLDEALFGDFDCSHPLTYEKPVHRTMINMAAAGYQVKEISIFTGCSISTVSNVLKQPWARKYLIKEAKKTVQDELKQLLEAEVIPSVKRLVAVRDSEKSKGADVISASNSLLNRFLGTPTQHIVTEEKDAAAMTDEELRQQVMQELRAKTN